MVVVSLGGCSSFSSSESPPPPDAGGAADSAAPGDAGAPPGEGRIRFRGAVTDLASAPAASDLKTTLPSGVQAGDLLWATVLFRGSATGAQYVLSGEWMKVEERVTTCASATPSSRSLHHYYRIATGAEERPFVLGRTSAFIAADVVVAAYAGVDKAQPVAAHALVDLGSGPLASPEVTSEVDDGRLLLSFTLMSGPGARWGAAAGVSHRPSLGELGVYDGVVRRGVVAPITVTSTAASICGASGLAAILRPAP